jgi:hypothetical protein
MLPTLALFAILPALSAHAQTRDDGGHAAGTGAVRGVVWNADRQPVRRAIVTISGDLSSARSAITDDEGRFAFRAVPEGRFTIGAAKAGYLPGAFGATRPGRPGTPLSLARGQQADVTIAIERGAVITGMLRDRAGLPVAGVQIVTLDPRAPSALTPLFSSAPITLTDDRGLYRLYGLMPGEYVIAALPKITGSGEIGAASVADLDALIARLQQRSTQGVPAIPRPVTFEPPPAAGFAPMYFPGTARFSEATRVRVASGEERDGVDMAIAPVQVATVSGTVSGEVSNLAAVQLSIVIGGPRLPATMGTQPFLAMKPDAEGRFRFANMTPGDYSIMARATRGATAAPVPARGITVGSGGGSSGAPSGSARPEYLYATADLDIRGQDVSGLALVLQPGSTFAGTIRFDAAGTPPADLTSLRVSLSPPEGTYSSSFGDTVVGNTFNAVPPVAVQADGRFLIGAIAPGLYALRCTVGNAPADAWWLRSAIAPDGRDLLDAPVTVRQGANYENVVLTLSDRHTELSGTLQAATGVPAPEFFVVAFPVDRTLRSAALRRVQAVRPASDGRFLMRDLPPGDYLLAALVDVAPNEWQEPAFLEQLVAGGVKVTIGEGERKVQDLRIK